MTRTHRVSMIGGVIVCLIGSQLSSPLLASEETSTLTPPAALSTPAPHFTYRDEQFSANPPVATTPLRIDPSDFTMIPAESTSFAQRYPPPPPPPPRYVGYHRNRAQREEIVLGALSSIAGGALLVYANRPECSSTDNMAAGCSYGTKVVGGAVLSAGIFGVALGALTWR